MGMERKRGFGRMGGRLRGLCRYAQLIAKTVSESECSCHQPLPCSSAPGQDEEAGPSCCSPGEPESRLEGKEDSTCLPEGGERLKLESLLSEL